MKIRLKFDLPVEKKHGATKGREYETIDPPAGMSQKTDRWQKWFMSDVEPVKALAGEWEKVK